MKVIRQTSKLIKTFQMGFATYQPSVLNRDMGEHQWYLHFSRTAGHDIKNLKTTIKDLMKTCEEQDINLTIGLGPKMLKETTSVKFSDEEFTDYTTFKAGDGSGKEAKATQEDLLVWINNDSKGLLWKTQWDLKQKLKMDMKLARETMTFIYGESLDLSGFKDGTGNPDSRSDKEVAIIKDGKPGEGGSFIIAQRWVHDLLAFEQLPLDQQEKLFGRTKRNSTELEKQEDYSHVKHTKLLKPREDTSGTQVGKRDQMTRRSTPYAFHDGTVGLYFMGFSTKQSPFIERMRSMYGMDGQVRDRLTSYSNPASGAFYFAPSMEVLNNW